MKRLMLISLIFLLTGCTGSVVKRIEQPQQMVVENGPATLVFFCPRDNCSKQFNNLAENAAKIDCAFFELNIPSMIKLLEEKNARLVIDNENDKWVKSGSLNYMVDYKGHLMHNKFCIFDDSIVWTGSFNPTVAGDRKTNNNVVVLFSKYLAQNYDDEFDEMWQGRFVGGNRVKYPQVLLNDRLVENYFCPEDCGTALTRVLKLIGEARSGIYFMTFSFTEDSIGNLLLEKHKQGLEVKGIFEKSANSRYSEYTKLKDAGVPVTFDSKDFIMHHKVFIIDNETVVTGSWNPTRNGLESNDENILIIHDKEIAAKYLTEFRLLWLEANGKSKTN
jgi:phosphatidylserine/phosphatidylglycerophosphate/cardiolipin synthase-like enzyme